MWSVAKYELLTLYRSWFFRIFAAMAIGLLTFLNITFFAQAFETMPLAMRALPGSIPYFNLILLNVTQAVIAVFLASDFLKRDKKLNSTEVIYMRSMSNADYVLGKLLGLLILFAALNLVVLSVGLLVNVAFSQIPVRVDLYGYYFLLISVPSLIFFIGLSFFVMSVVGNQAFTFILLLGYIAICLFFIDSKMNFMWDGMAFFYPLAYSDFLGFGQLHLLLIHRIFYFALGLGFIALTVFLLKRLPQSRITRTLAPISATILIAIAVFLASFYHAHHQQGVSLRRAMVQLNDAHHDKPRVTVERCSIEFVHHETSIFCEAKLVVRNPHQEPVAQYLFSLNPGLNISKIAGYNAHPDYTRESHLVFITPKASLAPMQSDSFSITYQGKVFDQAAYADVSEPERALNKAIFLYKTPKEFSFVTPKFVLLTKENLWYPMPGTTNGTNPSPAEKDFTSFDLKVRTKPQLQVFSQGKREQSGPGVFHFQPEHPLTQISLVIGSYETRSLQLNHVEYSLHTLHKHDDFVPFFADLGDTLNTVLLDAKQDFENRLGLEYPFPRFAIIEVPIFFHSFLRKLDLFPENIQPELVLLPEQGLLLPEADFDVMKRRLERGGRQRNQTISEKQMNAQIWSRFLRGTFFGGEPTRFRRAESMGQEYQVFPVFLSHVFHLGGTKWPLFSSAIEAYFSQKVALLNAPFMRISSGLTNVEKANSILRNFSLSEILESSEEHEELTDILKIKSEVLMNTLKSEVEPEKVDRFLIEFINAHRFRRVKVEQFVEYFQANLGIDLTETMHDWYYEKKLPRFQIRNVQFYQVRDRDRNRFQIKLGIHNDSDANGVVIINFQRRGMGAGGGREGFGFFSGAIEAPQYQRIIGLGPHQAKEIGVVLDEEPRAMSINTGSSENIPAILDLPFTKFDLNDRALPFSGERILTNELFAQNPKEIIVDNEDSGFVVLSKGSRSLIKRLLAIKLENESEYIGINPWRTPENWSKTIDSGFYGDFVHSAHVIKASGTDKRVQWKAMLPLAGQYDVFFYAPVNPRFFVQRGGRRGSQNRNEQTFARSQLRFYIYHDDGIQEEEVEIADDSEDWIYLGSYYFSADTARVELSNRGQGRMVVADAVKWIKK